MKHGSKAIMTAGALMLTLGSGLAIGKAHDQGVADGDREPTEAPASPGLGPGGVSGAVSGGARGGDASDAEIGRGGNRTVPDRP